MNARRSALFALPVALMLALGAVPMRAQAPAGPAPQVEAAPTAAGHPAAPEGEEGHAHHPQVTLLGHPLGRGAQFAIMVFNFILFAGLLVMLLKGALSSAFKARTKELEDKLSQAERDRAEAEARIRELEARMAGLQQELEGIMGKAEAEAETEKGRILESARAEAALIRDQTRTEIESQQRQAEAELRALVAELAVAGAAQRLEARVRGDLAGRVMDRAIEEVGGAK
jgi:F-type H+-transporting ATPase subunit b